MCLHLVPSSVLSKVLIKLHILQVPHHTAAWIDLQAMATRYLFCKLDAGALFLDKVVSLLP